MSTATSLKRPTQASTADRHELYQKSVQNSEFELDFIEDTFKEIVGRKPRSMREDFCGTAITACEWVQRDPENTAVGIDNDPEVLQWGQVNNVAALNDEQLSRLTLIEGDVLATETQKFDVVQAFNFSYWCFKERKTMIEYFSRVREALVDDGLFVLDLFGGSECHQTQREKRKVDGFKYIWDQAEYNALTNELTCHIHFHFPDKSKMKKAFTYDWRVWGAREIREILADAGFSSSLLYRQEFDEDDEALDEYIATEEGEDYACWLGFIVARR